MTFAARPANGTGPFPVLAMASAFSATGPAGGGAFSVQQWTLQTDGSITLDAAFPGASSSNPSSYGLPAVTNGGSEYECCFQINSGSYASSGGANISLTLFGTTITYGTNASGSIAPQTTPWYSLASAQSFGAQENGTIGLGSSGSVVLSGTVYVRHKITGRVISQSVSLNLQ